MSRLQWGIILSGMIHLGFIQAGNYFFVSQPDIQVVPGETRFEVVFIGSGVSFSPTIEETAVSKPELLEQEVLRVQPEERMQESLNAVSSTEIEGAQHQEADYGVNPPPVYPRMAILRNIQGRVLLWVEMNEQGIPLEVKVDESSGYQILDQAAVEAVWKWKFSPARLGKIPIRSQVRIPVQFKIVGKKNIGDVPKGDTLPLGEA